MVTASHHSLSTNMEEHHRQREHHVHAHAQDREQEHRRLSDNNNTSHSHSSNRALLEHVNTHLLCSLCSGYFIDATTIVECLHSFCRSCIVKHLRTRAYCPVCEMMINSARPNIKPDKALQDIVYKLVPGLFQREMKRRQQFYASRPGQAASATPEQRGEDTERIIFSPEDVISFSLEYVEQDPDRPGAASSSESGSDEAPGEENAAEDSTRRFLQCPAVVNVSHLKKFLAMKYDVDCARFAVDVLYKKVPLPDYYTLMDIAYIYNWKRNRPMRFFYHITDLLALRDRVGIFGAERPGSRARAPPRPRDPPDASPPRSDESSGSCSPPPPPRTSSDPAEDGDPPTSDRSSSADAEKSQFLNSFELTAKSPATPSRPDDSPAGDDVVRKPDPSPSKRKSGEGDDERNRSPKKPKMSPAKEPLASKVEAVAPPAERSAEALRRDAEPKRRESPLKVGKKEPDPPEPHSAKRKFEEEPRNLPPAQKKEMPRPPLSVPSEKKIERIPIASHDRPRPPPPPKLLKTPPKTDHPVVKKSADRSAPRPSTGMSAFASNAPKKNLERCPPPQHLPSRPLVKTPHPKQPPSAKSGDPLKSLFDSCNINIPSSLSITLTDQKSDENGDPQNPNGEGDKNSRPSNNPASDQASSAMHNYIEILKVPETETPKKSETSETKAAKTSASGKSDTPTSAKGPVPNLKPIADAKHIKPPSVAKSNDSLTFQQTFLQSLQQQSDKPKYIKTRIDFPKGNSTPSKPPPSSEAPSERPSTPKAASVPINKPKPIPIAQPIKKSVPSIVPKVIKSDSALDLSTPHPPVQSQLGPQQTKALETMQSIANLAKRQSFTQRMTSPSQVFSQDSFKMGASSASPLRIPIPSAQNKHLNKTNNPLQNSSHSPKHFPEYFQPVKLGNSNNGSQNNKSSPSPHNNSSSSFSQTSQRTQNRSPSSSPKLVIACPSPKSQSPEQKQLISPKINENGSQSNTISSSHITSSNHVSGDISKDMKSFTKTTKPVPGSNKINTGARSSNSTQKPGTSGNGNSGVPDILHMHPHLVAQQYLRNQLELQTQLGYLPPETAAQWFNNPATRIHFETFMKNMAHNSQLPFPGNPNMKDK